MLIKGTVKGYGPVEFNVTSVEFEPSKPATPRLILQDKIETWVANTFGLNVYGDEKRELRAIIEEAIP